MSHIVKLVAFQQGQVRVVDVSKFWARRAFGDLGLGQRQKGGEEGSP